MNDAVLSINSTLGKRASAEVSGLENKVKASMRAVLKENWMETQDEALFRAGVAGALLDLGLDSDDGKRLRDSFLGMSRFAAMLNAAAAGIAVNMETVLPKDGEEMLPLLGWWHDVKEKTNG